MSIPRQVDHLFRSKSTTCSEKNFTGPACSDATAKAPAAAEAYARVEAPGDPVDLPDSTYQLAQRRLEKRLAR